MTERFKKLSQCNPRVWNLVLMVGMTEERENKSRVEQEDEDAVGDLHRGGRGIPKEDDKGVREENEYSTNY